jgi:hypothetical protein
VPVRVQAPVAQRPRADPPAEPVAPPTASPGTRPAPREATAPGAADLARIEAALKAAEEQGRQIDQQRRTLERAQRDEELGRAMVELKARLEALQGAMAATSRQVESGAADRAELIDLHSQIAQLERQMSGLRASEQLRHQVDALEDRKIEQEAARQALMQQYDALLQARNLQQTARQALMERYAALVQGRDATVRAADATVVLTVQGRATSFVPRDRPYTQGGPSAGFHVAEDAGAHTADGRIISGIEVIGWHEGDAIRVLVFALVPREGEPNRYTTDGKVLARVDAGTYLLIPGHAQALDELSALGVKDASLQLSAPTSSSPGR